MPDVIDRSLAKQIGEILQVDGVFFGTVSEFWYRTRASAAMQEEPAVGINVKLVDSITGKVVWAGSYSRSSYDISTYDRDSLNRVAQITVENMVDSISAIKGVK
jgi:hypothetical protein